MSIDHFFKDQTLDLSRIGSDLSTKERKQNRNGGESSLVMTDFFRLQCTVHKETRSTITNTQLHIHPNIKPNHPSLQR